MVKTILSKRDLFKALTEGVWTKLEEDEELTCYHVLDFSRDELLICYGQLSWRTGEVDHRPHRIKQKDKGKTWFLKNPFEMDKKKEALLNAKQANDEDMENVIILKRDELDYHLPIIAKKYGNQIKCSSHHEVLIQKQKHNKNINNYCIVRVDDNNWIYFYNN